MRSIIAAKAFVPDIAMYDAVKKESAQVALLCVWSGTRAFQRRYPLSLCLNRTTRTSSGLYRRKRRPRGTRIECFNPESGEGQRGSEGKKQSSFSPRNPAIVSLGHTLGYRYRTSLSSFRCQGYIPPCHGDFCFETRMQMSPARFIVPFPRRCVHGFPSSISPIPASSMSSS